MWMSTSGAQNTSVASGRLAETPLAHALIYIRNKRLSGVLELRASAERHACLVFWRGLVVSSMTTPTVARFGTVVYELGMIDSETLDASTRASAEQKRTQMDILLERGAITAAQRDEVIVEQARRRVHHLFTLPSSTRFTFREGTPSSSEPAFTVDVLAPVWRGLCDFPLDERVSEVLAGLGDHPLKLVSEALIERAGLEPAEVTLCEVLSRSPMSLAELRAVSAISKVPPRQVDLLVYLLVISRSVEMGADRIGLPSTAMWAAVRPTRSSAAYDAVAQSGVSTRARLSIERLAATQLPAAQGPADLGIAEIRRRVANLSTETPFAALGLADGASVEAARAAHFRLSRLWNPDRLPPELDAVRAEVGRIHAHLTRAHATLTSPDRAAVAARRGGR
jgi:hypothetical protein